MKALLGNFPNRLVALLARIIIFPFGYRYALPNDQFDHKLAKIMMTPQKHVIVLVGVNT